MTRVRNALEAPARGAYRLVKRHRLLSAPAGWLSRAVASAPSSSPMATLFGPLRTRLRGAMQPERVLEILNVLAVSEVPFSVAGGWGVDALLGRQSRTHDDLDISIDDYDNEIGRAISALEPLGYRLVATREQRAWMPKLAILDDGTGHGVELVSLNWGLLARDFGPPGADASRREEFEDKIFAEGRVGDQRVPCLSADVQMLFHTNFELTPTLRQDVTLLRDELGAVLPEEGTAP